MERRFRAAAIQLSSGTDRTANFAAAARQLDRAADAGARLVVLPELWSVLGPPEVVLAEAEPLDGPTGQFLAAEARRRQLVIVGGSFAERSPDPARAYNTTLVVDPTGAVRAVYRKLHLFDVDWPGRVTYRESDWLAPGDRVVAADVLGLRLGLAICYDLRFPVLFDRLAAADCRVLAVPAAFTAVTGRDHWHLLVRARALETQCYLIAANQSGTHSERLTTYGHSAVVDPWGRIVAECDAGEGCAVADVDLDRLDEIRGQLPVLRHRRPLGEAGGG